MWTESYDESVALYLVPTPIGNLNDITLRAIEVLRQVDYIFTEDTRTTRVLLKKFDINKRLISLHDHNEDKAKKTVLKCLENGKNVALVTDRGTPIISDPGYKTVRFLIDNNKKVIALPGPCALITALITSGLAPQPFLFYGFLNSKDKKKEEELEGLKYKSDTLIFYEAPHRIKDTLESMYNILGDRRISISREITKKYENIYHGSLKEIVNNNKDIIGELVLVVEGCTNIIEDDLQNKFNKIEEYSKMGLNISDAIKVVAHDSNISKNRLYEEYHKWRKK